MFVRYEIYVDENERKREVAPKYRLTTFFGQLVHLLVARFKDLQQLDSKKGNARVMNEEEDEKEEVEKAREWQDLEE
ncbi:hypothetical protein PM082_018358 [Marasmius tenuissimus]|nr:hypothetical protein PM082_018358 [Marasmius tenuissimus]